MNANITINSNEFQKHQLAFTHWIRHSDNAPLPSDISEQRMTIYRDLIFNNISSFVEHTYPVTQALLPDQLWRDLIEAFFQYGQCDSPYYYDISLHFKEFVDQDIFDHESSNQLNAFTHLQSIHQDYPWLRELMQYEWMELHVDIAEVTWLSSNSAESKIFDLNQLASEPRLKLRTTCWVLAYQYPVHTWSNQTLPAEIQLAPTCLLIYRDQNYDTQIYPIHPLWAFLIDILQTQEEANFSMLTTQLQHATQFTTNEIDDVLSNLLTWLQILNLLQVT